MTVPLLERTLTVLGYMRTSITTFHEIFKEIIRQIRVIFRSILSLRFSAFGGGCRKQILENKAISHARAAEVGGFTPNMG